MKELPCSSDSCLQCPGCKDKKWNVDELVTNCNMSPDEQLFFYKVAIINKRTDDLKREHHKSMPCLLNRDPSWRSQTVVTARSLSELWNVYCKFCLIIVLGIRIYDVWKFTNKNVSWKLRYKWCILNSARILYLNALFGFVPTTIVHIPVFLTIASFCSSHHPYY